MTTALVRSLGWPRVLVGGSLLVSGGFLVLALSQMEHFGWGFQFLDAAIRFAFVAPIVLAVDSAIAVVQWVVNRQKEQFSQRQEALLIYLFVMWGLWALYFALISH